MSQVQYWKRVQLHKIYADIWKKGAQKLKLHLLLEAATSKNEHQESLISRKELSSC